MSENTDRFPKIKKLLLDNGARAESVKTLEEGSDFTNEKTYVITRSMDFPQYADFVKSPAVSLVTPEWVIKCTDEQRIHPKEPFSPDPRHILRDIAISVTGLSKGDTEAILGGAWALGAQFSNQVIVYTTHLVTTDDSLEKCQMVRKSGKNIKIVLPDWINDCIKLRRRVDDTPYCFPNPSILQLTTAERMAEAEDVEKFKYTHSSSNSEQPPQNNALDSYSDILGGKNVFLAHDLELNQLGEGVKDLIKAMGGGKIVTNVEESDIYLGKWRGGDDYITACNKGLIVGNLTWLYYMAFHNIWCSPLDHLLHYPLPPKPLKGMEGAVISVTNYIGEARQNLEELITALGAKYERNLTMSYNTHLICAYPEGRKYDAAKEWNLDIVNHLWLEECFALWSMQPISNRKYSYLPAKVNLSQILGMTKLVPEVLKQFSNEGTVRQENIEKEDLESRRRSSSHEPDKVRNGTPPLDLQTPLPNKKLNTYGKKSSSGKRRAPPPPQLAFEPPIANDKTGSPKETKKTEQNENDNNNTEYVHEDTTDKNEDNENNNEPAQPVKKKRKSSHLPQEDTTTNNKPTPTATPELNIILAGLDDADNKKLTIKKTKLAKLGIIIVEDPDIADCIIAVRRRTSEKFLRALSIVRNVVHPDYLFSCLEKEERVEPIPEEYLVSNLDEGLKTSIETRMEKFSNEKSSLFKGYKFNMAVGSLFSQLDRVIQSHGGGPSQKINARNPKSYSISEEDKVILLIIGDERDKNLDMRENLQKRVLENEQKFYVFDRSWLTEAIIKMDIELDDHSLAIPTEE